MDNFDHDEGTSSGIGGSHDTILMLFQNRQSDTEEPQKDLSKKPENSSENRKSLANVLSCQKLLKGGKFGGRGQIPRTFLPGQELDFSSKINESAKEYQRRPRRRKNALVKHDLGKETVKL